MSEIDDLEVYESPQRRQFLKGAPKGVAKTTEQKRALRRARAKQRYAEDAKYRERVKAQRLQWWRAKKQAVGEAC